MKHVFQVCLLMAFLTGCGSSWEGPKVQVKMEEVPPAALKTAQEKFLAWCSQKLFLKKMAPMKFGAKPRLVKSAKLKSRPMAPSSIWNNLCA